MIYTEQESLLEAERRIISAETALDLTGLRLSIVPDAVRHLRKLRTLVLADNLLLALPEWLGELGNLELLDLTQNRLTCLPESLTALDQLHTLYLNLNDLRAIPQQLHRLKHLSQLGLLGNPALKVPVEILCTLSAEKVLDYSARITPPETSEPLNEFKLIVVGRGGVGKTSLVHKLRENTFAHFGITPGIAITSWRLLIDGNMVRAHIWDFGGQEILHGTHRFFLTERAVYLVLVSGRENTEDRDADYWLSLVRSFAGSVPIIVLLHRYDEFRFELNLQLLREKYGADLTFLETDSSTGTGISELRQQISAMAKKLPGLKVPWPASWKTVKDKLPELTRNWLTFRQFSRYCTQWGVSEPREQDLLLDNLHVLGLILSYRKEEMLREFGILNPQWVTRAIYMLLTSNELRKAGGVLTLDTFARVFPIASSNVHPSDILNVGWFADFLQTRNQLPPLLEFMHDRLGRMNPGLRSKIDASSEEAVKRQLAEALNDTIMYHWLPKNETGQSYEDSLAGMEISEEIKFWIRICPDQIRVARLNRLLVDNFCGDAIKTLSCTDPFPREMHPYLLALMHKFRLCHLLGDDGDKHLVPELLTKQEPVNYEAMFPYHECLGFIYIYDSVLPEGLFPRFIVETYVYQKPGAVWRTGVILQHGDSECLVRADIQSRKIEIWSIGNENKRRELLGIVREHFERIHASYMRLPITPMVPIPKEPSVSVRYSELLEYEDAGDDEFKVTVNKKVVRLSVRELLDRVDLSGAPRGLALLQRARSTPPDAISLFISYSGKDGRFRDEFRSLLTTYERQGELSVWDDTLVEPGKDWDSEILNKLERATIVALLLSNDFIQSDYCYQKEMERALERDAAGECAILPIVVKACPFTKIRIGKLQAILPKGRPIDQHRHRAAAWFEVSKHLDQLIARIKNTK